MLLISLLNVINLYKFIAQPILFQNLNLLDQNNHLKSNGISIKKYIEVLKRHEFYLFQKVEPLYQDFTAKEYSNSSFFHIFTLIVSEYFLIYYVLIH